MHEDDIVVILEIEPVSGSIIKVGNQVNKGKVEKTCTSLRP